MCTSMIDHSSKFIFFLFIFQPPLMVLKVHWTTQRVDTVMTQIMEFQWNSGCTSASIKLVGQKSVVQFQSCVTFLLHGEDLHCFQTSFLHPCVKRHWAKWKWRYRSALLLLFIIIIILGKWRQVQGCLPSWLFITFSLPFHSMNCYGLNLNRELQSLTSAFRKHCQSALTVAYSWEIIWKIWITLKKYYIVFDTNVSQALENFQAQFQSQGTLRLIFRTKSNIFFLNTRTFLADFPLIHLAAQFLKCWVHVHNNMTSCPNQLTGL